MICQLITCQDLRNHYDELDVLETKAVVLHEFFFCITLRRDINISNIVQVFVKMMLIKHFRYRMDKLKRYVNKQQRYLEEISASHVGEVIKRTHIQN